MRFSDYCFINFKQLAVINGYTKDIELSMLFGAIRFQVNRTKLPKGGRMVIARTKKQLANMIGCSVSTIGRKLKELKQYSLIGIILGKWYGKKRMFVSCKEDVGFSVNITKMKFLNKYTGSLKASVALAYFAYEISKGYPTKCGPGWCHVVKTDLAKLLGVESARAAHLVVKGLEDRGLIQRRGHYGVGGAAFLVKINEGEYDRISADWARHEEELALKRAALKAAKTQKMTLSINNRDISTVETKDNNINFNQQDCYRLSAKELSYAKAAVERTVLNAKVGVGDIASLWRQVRFALFTPQHRKGTQNFKHAVNRFMLLIRTGAWRMPFGYEKYSDDGRQEYLRMREHEKKHQDEKLPVKEVKKQDVSSYEPIQYFEPVESLKKAEKVGDLLKTMGVNYGLASG